MYFIRSSVLFAFVAFGAVASFTHAQKLKLFFSPTAVAGLVIKPASSVEPVRIAGLGQGAQLVVTGKLTSSKKDQLVACQDSVVRVYSIEKDSARLIFSVVVDGVIQKLIIGDADQDGKNDLVMATGKAGKNGSKDVSVFVVSNKGNQWLSTLVYQQGSERPEPTFLGLADINGDGRNDIICSYFESRYFVQTVAIYLNKPVNTKLRVLEKRRMATARDIGVLPGHRAAAMVVGRPYGDSLGLAGDAYILAEKIELLPSFRGVKTVRIADLDGDGKNEIFMGDGWHQDYGKIARGRISMLSYDDFGYHYELIEDVKNQYETSQIEVADLDGDAKNELLVRGNKYFRIYTRTGKGWRVFTEGHIPAAQFAVGDVNGDGYKDVVFAGNQRILVYDFKKIEYSSDLGSEMMTEVIDPSSLLDKKAPELVINKWYGSGIKGLGCLKGKVVVLDFWATWCRPCIKMFPVLRNWQEKYADKGLVILGLTKPDGSQDFKKIEDFVAEQPFPYAIGVAEEANNNLRYGVSGIPHIVLIDREGYVRRFEIGAGDGKEFEMAIQKYLLQ